MNREEYMQEIKRTWQTGDLTQREEMCNAALGLVGETREYFRALEARADYHDGADEVRAQNIAKLRRRYPRGFEEGGGVR